MLLEDFKIVNADRENIQHGRAPREEPPTKQRKILTIFSEII